jgi:hypothetical protein
MTGKSKIATRAGARRDITKSPDGNDDEPDITGKSKIATRAGARRDITKSPGGNDDEPDLSGKSKIATRGGARRDITKSPDGTDDDGPDMDGKNQKGATRKSVSNVFNPKGSTKKNLKWVTKKNAAVNYGTEQTLSYDFHTVNHIATGTRKKSGGNGGSMFK